MKVNDILFPGMSEQNESVFLNLKNELTKNGEDWALVLGAGVSISAGLPDWFGLLAKITAQVLMVECTEHFFSENNMNDFDKGIKQFVEKCGNTSAFLDGVEEAMSGSRYSGMFQGMNVLEAAEYIRNYMEQIVKDKDELAQKDDVALELNEQINYFIQEACRLDSTIVDERTLKTEAEKESVNRKLKDGTLGAVARLMKSDSNSIHNAITYNFDNLLETGLRYFCDCKNEQVKSVIKFDSLPDWNTPESWNIYHVHGCIPVIDNGLEKMSERVIFTESDYYDEEEKNYSWTNVIQSYAIEKASLIFIGFSGADYNFRRIIKHVKKEKDKRHHNRFIFFCVDDIVKACFSKELKSDIEIDECIRQMNLDNGKYSYEKIVINYFIHAKTEYWKNNGIQVIWSSIDDLAAKLDSLR